MEKYTQLFNPEYAEFQKETKEKIIKENPDYIANVQFNEVPYSYDMMEHKWYRGLNIILFLSAKNVEMEREKILDIVCRIYRLLESYFPTNNPEFKVLFAIQKEK